MELSVIEVTPMAWGFRHYTQRGLFIDQIDRPDGSADYVLGPKLNGPNNPDAHFVTFQVALEALNEWAEHTDPCKATFDQQATKCRKCLDVHFGDECETFPHAAWDDPKEPHFDGPDADE